MEHELKLQPNFFNYVKYGTKRIELRLYDEKRQKINIGDTIIFRKEPELTEMIEAKVIGLLRYASFAESMTKQELLSTLNKFYTLEKQRQYGIIGIRIKLKS